MFFAWECILVMRSVVVICHSEGSVQVLHDVKGGICIQVERPIRPEFEHFFSPLPSRSIAWLASFKLQYRPRLFKGWITLSTG